MRPNTCKYVNFSNMGIILFPDTITHRWMADRFPAQEVVGAGFVSLDTMKCYGYSSSLDVASTEADTKLLRCQTYYEATT